ARFGFSVTIVCFFSVFSFFGSGCCAARARCVFHSVQRWDMLETSRKRGFRNFATHEKEKVVARRSDMRKLLVKTTSVPGAFNDASSLSAMIVPTRPPGGMWPRIGGTSGDKANAVERVKGIRIIPMTRNTGLRTGQDASQ